MQERKDNNSDSIFEIGNVIKNTELGKLRTVISAEEADAIGFVNVSLSTKSIDDMHDVLCFVKPEESKYARFVTKDRSWFFELIERASQVKERENSAKERALPERCDGAYDKIQSAENHFIQNGQKLPISALAGYAIVGLKLDCGHYASQLGDVYSARHGLQTGCLECDWFDTDID